MATQPKFKTTARIAVFSRHRFRTRVRRLRCSRRLRPFSLGRRGEEARQQPAGGLCVSVKTEAGFGVHGNNSALGKGCPRLESRRLIGVFEFMPPCGRCQLYWCNQIGKFVGAPVGRGVGLSVSPFPERGLDEALGLAVCFGRIGLGADVLDSQIAASIAKGLKAL